MKKNHDIKHTGWDSGLSQDYNRGLGAWFAGRMGARYQLREMFNMDINGNFRKEGK